MTLISTLRPDESARSAERPALDQRAVWSITARTHGQTNGGITRLMSPSDLGERLKPFVFLDLFDFDAVSVGAMPIHPHSGIATVTLVTEGNVRFDDANSGMGIIDYGGVEWMRAGGGVWHGQEMSRGASSRIRGYQLWIALPADLENSTVDSQYLEADCIPQVGPARVVVGSYSGAQSPVRAPPGINYLLITLGAGQRWSYVPPTGHAVTFAAVSRGRVHMPEPIAEGELAVFAQGADALTFEAELQCDAVFVIGSALLHPHPLKLGRYSVHTSEAALAAGEKRISDLFLDLRCAGNRGQSSGATPIFR